MLNYVVYGGFCFVNMVVGMIYMIGGLFWEFGGFDFDYVKLFFMIGIVEDYYLNLLKIVFGKFKCVGGCFIVINLVCIGYVVIVDEWILICFGIDGVLFMVLMYELIVCDVFDYEFVLCFMNVVELVDWCDGVDMFGLFVCDVDVLEVNLLYL